MNINNNEAPGTQVDPGSALSSWVMDRVDKWRSHRDTNYKEKWDEYYRIWKGEWAQSDALRKSERSRIVTPASMQAVDMTVAEQEETVFSRATWFDIKDNKLDKDPSDALMVRDLLLEEFDKTKVAKAVSEAFLNGAILGTGIGKIIVAEVDELVSEVDEYGTPQAVARKTVRVSLEPVLPRNFVIDPNSRTIDDGLGCAHEIVKPKHSVIQKQQAGQYRQVDIGDYQPDGKQLRAEQRATMAGDSDGVLITEYHGLVPEQLLYASDGDAGELEAKIFNDALSEGEYNETVMVEAIVTIGNGSVLLKAVANPNLMKDRAFIAYQQDTVPDSFWGRGVIEKGYNPQKALDGEVRARLDALALTAHPMIAADATRLQRGMDYKVRPGKVWLTLGDPKSAITPFSLMNNNTTTFNNAADLERMVQVGTGAMDSAMPTSGNARNATASGMSMMQSGFIKRAKRTMKNIELNFLQPLVTKAYWRYLQYAPERFPATDVTFAVKASMGIMAREFEQNQLTQLLSVIPQDHPSYQVLLKSIFENSSSGNKDEMLKAIEQANQPNPEQQQMQQFMQQIAMKKAVREVEEVESKILFNRARSEAVLIEANLEDERVEIDSMNAVANLAQNRVAQIERLVKAQKEDRNDSANTSGSGQAPATGG